MKATLVIDLPNDFDISLDENKVDITISSIDIMISRLYCNNCIDEIKGE